MTAVLQFQPDLDLVKVEDNIKNQQLTRVVQEADHLTYIFTKGLYLEDPFEF